MSLRLPALLLVVMTGSGCGSDTETGGGSGSGSSGEAGQICVDTINQDRATLGLPAYARWSDAEGCASDQAGSDSESGQPHGAFGNCGESAQNECPGWPGPEGEMIVKCLAAMWSEGPGSDFASHGHYLNMSSAQFTKVSCGFRAAADGSIWAVQDFQ